MGLPMSVVAQERGIAGPVRYMINVKAGVQLKLPIKLARMFHELVWRDCADGRSTGIPQWLELEAYLNSTSQGSSPEDAREDAHIRGRSSPLMKYPG